ncbi:DUF6069 family protein [Actinoplanes sp. NPDC049668]|uniref:DUF6069 family protein n=1 Tax=unclassified Actinoplanes TaxID=2626549 RepID=UPI0033A735BA
MRRLTRGLAVVAAVGATYTVWTLAHQIAGVELVVDGGSVTPAAVVLATVIAGLAAWALLALLERLTRRAAAIWSGIAGAVLLVSLLGPIGSAVGAGATAALVAMHLAAGAVLIPLLAHSSVACRASVASEPDTAPSRAVNRG